MSTDMWQKKVILLLFLLLPNGSALKQFLLDQRGDLNGDFDNGYVIDCVVDLTQITIIVAPMILVLKDKNDENGDLFGTKMIKMFARNDVPIVIQDKYNHHINQTCDVYNGNVIVIAHFKNCDSLSNFNIHDVDKRVKHIIVISEYTNESFTQLKEFGHKYVERDVTYVLRDQTNEKHSMETFIPLVDEKACKLEEVELKQINVCSKGSLKTNIVFLDEVRVDFKRCPFKVGMATMFPFSKIPNKDQLKDYDLIDEIEGSDVEIMKIIATYFNATPEWHYLDREEQNPFTKTAYFEFIVNGSLDASAGGLYNIYGDLVSYSGIYTRRAVIWIYTINRASRSWYNLVQKLHGIHLFFIFYISYSILSYLFRKYDCERTRIKDILFYSWGALLGVASLQQPRSLKHKILDIFYLVLSIYLSAYMSIQLFSFLTIDRPSDIFKTNDEVLASGRTPYLHPIHKYFIQDEKYLAFANTSKDCGSFADCENKTLAFNGLTVILDQYFYKTQATTAVNDEAKILKATQNVVTIYHEMLIRKDSPLVVGIQTVLNRLFEAGICMQLFKEAIGITVIAKAESANKNAISNSYSCESGCAITLAQVAGVFYVWIIGCFLSFCVFLFEIMWKRRNGYKVE